MSINEHLNGQKLEDTLLLDMKNLKCSKDVDQVPVGISDGENLTKRFLTFSNPNLASTNEFLAGTDRSTGLLIDQEESDFNASPILLNAFDSTGISADTQSVDNSLSDSIPMTELSSCASKCRSEDTLPFQLTATTSGTGKDCERVEDFPNHQSIQPHMNGQTSTRSCFKRDKDALGSTDILQEAIQILHSLTLDISRSLDDIPKSIALPSVIEKYSRRSIEKSNPQDNPSSRQNSKEPVDDISRFISPSEEILQLLAALQCRCLEYREAALDLAESIVKHCLQNFSDVSIYVMRDLITRYDGLREDFTKFKKLCFKAKGSRTGAESLTDLITDCLQTSYLRLLAEENETFLVRLKFGIYMVRVNARLMRDLNEASVRVKKLEEEVDFITRTTIGYRV